MGLSPMEYQVIRPESCDWGVYRSFADIIGGYKRLDSSRRDRPV